MQGPPPAEMPGGWPAQDHQDKVHGYACEWDHDNGDRQPASLGYDSDNQPPSTNHEQPNPAAHVYDQYPDEHHWGDRYDPGRHRVNDDREPLQHGNEAPSDHFYHSDHTGYRDDSAKAPDLEQQRRLGTPQTAEVGADGAARDSRWQPDSPAVHYQHYHPLPKKKKKRSSGSVQAKSRVNIANPQQPVQQATGGGDNLSMLMMQQMMMQQMQAQQMQAQQMQTAQMAALAQAQMQRLSTGGGGAGGNGATSQAGSGRSLPKTKVNIKTKKRKAKVKSPPKVRAVAVPPVLNPAQRQQTLGAAGSSALDNWQEATIILCIAIIGLIYLVSTRASENKDGKEEKKPSVAAKYMI